MAVVRVFEKFFEVSSIFLSLSPSSCLIDGTRVAPRLLCSHGLRYPFPHSIPRDQIKNRFPATISVLIGTVRRCATSMLLSSSCKKSVPKEVHLVPIKRPFYTPTSALVFLSAFSPLPFGSREPFIEENPFNVFFDVTAAAVTLFFYHSRNHAEVRSDFVSLPSACVSYYSVTAMEYPLTVQSILTK